MSTGLTQTSTSPANECQNGLLSGLAYTLSTSPFSGVSHCGIMWALDCLLCFLIQLAAQADSSGEHQGSACDTISPLVLGQVWEETVTGE